MTFLGMRVAMDGTVALGRRKAHRFLNEARRRAENTADALADVAADERGAQVTAVVNSLLDPDDGRLQAPAAPLLARIVTDRRQLEQLDHQLALIVASAATGAPGARAFRRVPYRQIRSEWKLRSLRRSRDRSFSEPRAALGRARRPTRAPAPDADG